MGQSIPRGPIGEQDEGNETELSESSCSCGDLEEFNERMAMTLNTSHRNWNPLAASPIPVGSDTDSPYDDESSEDDSVQSKDGRLEDFHPANRWARNTTWPKDDEWPPTIRPCFCDDSRSEASSGRDPGEREPPNQYTLEWEDRLPSVGLDLDVGSGPDYVSQESKQIVQGFLEGLCHTEVPLAVPNKRRHKMIKGLKPRTEPIVRRDVTPIIIPTITSLEFEGEPFSEGLVDEIGTEWWDHCTMIEPTPKPDLAIGLSNSAFQDENAHAKLQEYSMSPCAPTQFTEDMYYPFLMCEVRCGTGGLDIADRKNMSSCSAAVSAILRITQEADLHRHDQEFLKLSGKILVYSISHDRPYGRLFGYFAHIDKNEMKWSCHRYYIATFNIIYDEDLFTITRFVRNVLRVHSKDHIKRINDAISALPEPSPSEAPDRSERRPIGISEEFREVLSRHTDKVKDQSEHLISLTDRIGTRLKQQLERMTPYEEGNEWVKTELWKLELLQGLFDILKDRINNSAATKMLAAIAPFLAR